MSRTTVNLEQRIAAAPAQVFHAFTNSTALREWLCDAAMVVPRKDGRLHLWWNSGYHATGEFTKVVPDERVCFTWRGRGEPAESRVSLALQPDGKILVGGYASYEVDTGWDEDFALAMYQPNGSLYTGFSTDGLETVDFGALEEQGFALALQPGGKFIISGSSGRYLAMARFIYELPIRLHAPVILR